jgi:transposase
MDYKQNERIAQVNEEVLVIGVDIAKKTHYARAFNFRGIELGTVIKFNSDNEGFKEFKEWMFELMSKHNKKSSIVGIEPTGHYWYTFAETVIETKAILVQVNPYHVKRAKELDDGTQNKTDRKDPKTIAMLMKDGRYQIPYLPKGVYADIRRIYNIREKYVKTSNQIKNQLVRWLDIYFPEYTTVFKDLEGKASLATLTTFPLPSMIDKLSVEEIVSIWRKTVKRAVGVVKATQLKKAASMTVGVKRGEIALFYEINDIVESYVHTVNKLSELENIIEETSLEIPEIKNIASIKGIGIISAFAIVSEIGDIRRFDSPKQIIKYAGLNLVENSSGKHKSKRKISKRGRSKLRKILYMCVFTMVSTNKEFRYIHKYNTIKRHMPMKKKKSIVALTHKLVKIIYSLVVNDEIYDGNKLMVEVMKTKIIA